MRGSFSGIASIDVDAAIFAPQLSTRALWDNVLFELVKWTWLHIAAFKWTACHLRIMQVLFSVFEFEGLFTCLAFQLDLVEHVRLESGLRTRSEFLFAHRTLLIRTLLYAVRAEYLLASWAHLQVFHDEVADRAGQLLSILLGRVDCVFMRIPHCAFLGNPEFLFDLFDEVRRTRCLPLPCGRVEVSQTYKCCWTVTQRIEALLCVQLRQVIQHIGEWPSQETRI